MNKEYKSFLDSSYIRTFLTKKNWLKHVLWHYISTKYDACKNFPAKEFFSKMGKNYYYQGEGNKYSCINASQGNNKTIQRHNETQKLCFCVRLDVHKRQKIQAYVVTYLFSLVKCQEVCKKRYWHGLFSPAKEKCLRT